TQIRRSRHHAPFSDPSQPPPPQLQSVATTTPSSQIRRSHHHPNSNPSQPPRQHLTTTLSPHHLKPP
ncbi:hypothetical protein A2U01_0106543, partial [Trifolium medium]|nr:hypothetical protein [Trifolium medium]